MWVLGFPIISPSDPPPETSRSRSSMAPPTSSAEQTAESAAHERQQPYRRSLPTPFLTKTYQIVDDPALDHIISWNKGGSAFIVWRPAELASELLPKLFKHNNFSSFVRQLNTYGFRKIVPDRWEFGNERFRRGERHLLCDIHRRKVPAAAPPVTSADVTAIPVAAPTHSTEELSSNSSSVVAAPSRRYLIEENEKLRSEDSMLEEAGLMEENQRLRSENSMLKEAIGLIEENERLRRENLMLKEELREMTGVCDGIMMLMSNYSASQQAGEVTVATAQELMSSGLGEVTVATAQELMSSGLGEVTVATAQELMPSRLESDGVEGPAKETVEARLFGVTIGAKRAREEAGDVREVAIKPEVELS